MKNIGNLFDTSGITEQPEPDGQNRREPTVSGPHSPTQSIPPLSPTCKAVVHTSFHDCVKSLSEFACAGSGLAGISSGSAAGQVVHRGLHGHGLQQDIAMEAIRMMRLCSTFISKYPEVLHVFHVLPHRITCISKLSI